MAVDLNGFEKTSREQRKVLSIEQFNNYIDSTRIRYSDMIKIYILLKIAEREDDEFDYSSLYDEFEITSKKELTELLTEEMTKEGVSNITKDKLFSGIPEEVLKEHPNLDSEITGFNNIWELYDFFDSLDSIADELYEKKLMETAEEVSKHDLSQIPFELYAQAMFLKYINFQNTGAKLDFDYVRENRRNKNIFINCKNLQGTELISFDPIQYGVTRETKFYFWNEDDIKNNETFSQKNFDISQHQTIISSFNKANVYIPPSIANLLSTQELIDSNEWLINYAFSDLEKNTELAVELWINITPQKQFENEDKFVQLYKYQKTNYYVLDKTLISRTDPKIVEKYIDELASLFKNKEGVLDKEASFYTNVFRYTTDEYKEIFYRNISNLDDSSIADLALILRQTNDRFIDENLINLIEKCIENYGKNAFNQIGVVFNIFRGYEFNDLFMQYILDISEDYIKETKNNGYVDTILSIFSRLKDNQQLNYYKDFVKLGLKNDISGEDCQLSYVFDKMSFKEKFENFDEILEYAKSVSPEFAHYIRGTGYISMIHEILSPFPQIPETEGKKYIKENTEEILLSFRTKYENVENPYKDKLSPEKRKNFDKNYSEDYINILLDFDSNGLLNNENINIIIDNLPRLGIKIINRLYHSNSDMIITNATNLIFAVAELPKDEAISLIENIEGIFSKDTIPDFVKLYKFYEDVVERKGSLIKKALAGEKEYSPVLQQADSANDAKRVIFTDLFNISLRSNNKSLQKFLDVLENGNEVYIKFLKNDRNINTLSEIEQEILKKYSNTLYIIYEETATSRIDKKSLGNKIPNTKDYIKTLDDLSKRYMGNSFPIKLSDTIINSITGNLDELLAGRRTIADFKEYMESWNQRSNERHIALEKTKLVLEPGDLIKGIKEANRFLESIFSNGIRAGEFLGVDTHTDFTPLDTDFSLISPGSIKPTLSETIDSTSSASYGNFYIVIKKDRNKIQYTRDDPEYIWAGKTSPEFQSKRGKKSDKQSTKERMARRANNDYEDTKLEAFKSGVTGQDHYGIRTGISITDVDYIVVEKYDKRIGFELAMNGTFFPVVDKQTGEVVFGIKDYEKIRYQMQGLDFYGAKDFVVEKSAYIDKVEEKITELFPDGNVKESISEKDAKPKREAIEKLVRTAVLEKMQLGFKNKLTGDITPGFIEFIDTGSTGRGTNLPGEGDFDYSLKLDKAILDDPILFGKFKESLRTVLAKKSEDKDCSLDEVSDGFSYKKVKIDGIEEPLDIEISFMQKSESVQYSTDMAVRDRLNGLKEKNPEGYKRVTANIILAKEMLKKEGIYKKMDSKEATQYGGFGGVGVENWILQNGGSFVKAMQTFLEASKEAKSFEEFQEIYPIFDFGKNHKVLDYRHDSFIRGISYSGYTKMRETFEKFMQELSAKAKGEKGDSSVTLRELERTAVEEKEIRNDEFQEARESMIPKEPQKEK